jgi:Transposase DDE domain
MTEEQKAELRKLAAKRGRSTRGKPSPADDAKTEDDARKTSLPKSILGGKYVRVLDKFVASLRDEKAAHGNQKLFLDDVFVVHLLAFFNPVIRSLRTLEDLSQTPQAQKYLSTQSVCKSTLSDFNKLIEPERLEPILQALRAQLSRKQAGKPVQDKQIDTLLKQTIAVDGTFLPAVAEVAWAVANSNNHGGKHYRARLDARIDVHTWLPEAIVVPEAGQSESDSASQHVAPGKIYLYDRGYSGFDLLRAHYEDQKDGDQPLTVKAQFVVRYKKEGSNSPSLFVQQENAISEKDQAAGVVSDRVGYFESDSAKKAGISKCLLREVVIDFDENGEKKLLRLLTNLLDASAGAIGLLYRMRWQVELFFRWFKSIANFGHLISHSKQGALAHLYVTIIGVMLMYLHTGYRPSKYMFALLGQVAMGAATLEDIIPILRERERRNELDRTSAARRRAKNK